MGAKLSSKQSKTDADELLREGQDTVPSSVHPENVIILPPPTDDDKASSSAAADQAGPVSARVEAEALASQAVLPAAEKELAPLRGTSSVVSALPRLTMFTDMPDRGLFVGFILVGFAVIFGAKAGLWWLGFGDYSGTIAFVAVVLMVLYGVLARRITNVRLRADRLGDNFYYMGFIYTLASMSAALVEIRGGEDITSLIGSFGIALFSTIVGIAGRVTFVQMRTETEDIEERARHDLLEATQALKGQLSAALTDMETFRIGVQQVLRERLEEGVSTLGEAARNQARILDEAVREAISSAEKAFREHEANLSKLDLLGGRVTASVDVLATRLRAIDLPEDLVGRKLDLLFERLAMATKAFESAASADEARQQELVETSAQFRKVITQIANQVKKLQDGASELTEALRPGDRLAASLNKAAAALDGTVSSSRELHATLLANNKATEEISASVRAQSDLLVASTSAHRDAIVGLALESQKGRQQIAADLEASRSAAIEVQKALAETAVVVTRALAPETRTTP